MSDEPLSADQAAIDELLAEESSVCFWIILEITKKIWNYDVFLPFGQVKNALISMSAIYRFINPIVTACQSQASSGPEANRGPFLVTAICIKFLNYGKFMLQLWIGQLHASAVPGIQWQNAAAFCGWNKLKGIDADGFA